ncbi:MAG: sugar phosphate nucleotidyltransferase [Gemmatimonadota bacterium]
MSFDAMVLAAGYGRRLRPLTDETPKALVRVGQLTQLERTLGALERAGADRVVVNTHHHAENIEAFIEARDGAARILVSREDPRPLETGGGLLRARDLFRGDRPIVVHNVDVITSIDLAGLLERHVDAGGIATLAVQERAASRYLLFDEAGLQGRLEVRSGFREESRPQRGALRRLAFTGVHVVEPRVFGLMSETGSFSIIDVYLRLAGEGEAVLPEDVGAADWFEIGTPERLAAARAHFAEQA